MVDPVLKRGMFNQGPVDPGPDFAAPMGPSFGTPKKEKSTNNSLSYPTPAIDGALGLMGLDPTLITNLVDPQDVKDAYTSYAGEPKKAEDFAAVYDAIYEPTKQDPVNFKFEKNLALAKLGLALMKPQVGGAMTPAISEAGTGFLNDLAVINERKRQAKAKRGERESAEEMARRNYVLQSLESQANARDAGEMQLFMKTLEFNMNNDTRTQDYMRDLQKMYYNYQYDTDATAMSKHYDILKENYKKDPKVLYNPKTGTFAMGYIQNNEEGIPTPYFPIQDGENFDYIAMPNAIDTRFQLGTKGDFAPSGKQTMDIVGKMNGAMTAMRFIREIQQTISDDPSIVGIPGLMQKLTQTGTSTIMDLASYFADKGIIDSDGYNRTVNRLQNSALSSLSADFQSSTGNPDAQAFIDDGDDEMYEGAIYRKFFNPNIPQNEIRLNSIYYALARVRKDTGRLNVNDVDNAKASLSLTGFTSSDDVAAALEQVYAELDVGYQQQKRIFDTLDMPDAMITDFQFDSFAGDTKGKTVNINAYEVDAKGNLPDGSPGFVEEVPGG